MMLDTKPLSEPGIDKVLVISPEYWLYLELQKDVSVHASWLAGIDEHTVEMLDLYYELNPDKKPDAIYVECYYTDLVPLFEERGYHGTQTALYGYILYPE